MQIPLTKIFLVLMFIFVLFSNVLNYVAIATENWVIGGSTSIVQLQTIPKALIATGTALNILSLILAILSLSSICIEKVRNSLAVFFVFGCLVTTLLALLFNSTGWYLFLQKPPSTGFDYSFWLMTACFGCSVLAAVFAACIIGCSFALNKYESRQRKGQYQTQLQSPNEVFQVSTKNSSSFNDNKGYYANDERPGVVQTSYSYQNEIYQNEQKVLRL